MHSQKESSELVGIFFSGRRWSDDTESRVTVIRTNGEQEKQKEWERERGQGHREGARGQLEGQAVCFVCLQQQYRAAESCPMTVSLRAVCTLSTHPHTHTHTHTRVTAELLSCRCSQLETATLLKSDCCLFFYFPVKYAQVHASQTFMLNDIWVLLLTLSRKDSQAWGSESDKNVCL